MNLIMKGLIDWSIGVAVGRGTIVITMTRARIIDGRFTSILLEYKSMEDPLGKEEKRDCHRMEYATTNKNDHM